MPPRLRVSADFRPWRVVCLVCAAALVGLGFRLLHGALGFGGFAAAGPALLGLACFIVAAILIAPPLAGLVVRPLTSCLGNLFYPAETLRKPPEDLLRALRMRLRDRAWESVDQQTAALIVSYGPSPELYHLRALLAGGRSGDHAAVTLEASARLPARAFALYSDLLRRDPPPRTVQTGIEA
jgi:hypothetical protein